jgi:spermidine synthase
MPILGAHSRTVGVIGLGTGNMSCWGNAAQSWTFYEIDPLVHHLAAHSGLFRSLPLCVPGTDVILGDGRLKLEAAPAGAYDMFIVDAFSSDAIPIHLMTKEAFDGYRRVLSEHGVLVLHVTNRHFDLVPIVARIAGETGFVAYERSFVPPPDADPVLGAPTRWMVLAKDPADAREIASDGKWTRRDPDPGTKLWTDDFANILSALR